MHSVMSAMFVSRYLAPDMVLLKECDQSPSRLTGQFFLPDRLSQSCSIRVRSDLSVLLSNLEDFGSASVGMDVAEDDSSSLGGGVKSDHQRGQ